MKKKAGFGQHNMIDLKLFSKWPIQSERLIAFYDIAGFKERVFRIKATSTYSKLEKIYDMVISMLDFTQPEIYSTMFSDSIFLISKNADRHIEFIDTAITVFNEIMNIGLPVSGVISFGKLTVNTNKRIFFGRALIDAFELQKEMLLYSLILHHSVESFVDKDSDCKNLRYKSIDYKTPFKFGSTIHKHILLLNSNENKQSKFNFPDVNRFYKTSSGKNRIYIDNTINFYEHMNNLKTI